MTQLTGLPDERAGLFLCLGVLWFMERLGVDTGGTFTDFVGIDAGGRLRIHKQLSTPADPSRAILDGVRTLNLPPDAAVIHGSTVATNALLERRGARTALITTRGFADVLAIGRQNRPDLYALLPQRPVPLIPEEWRWEVAERITAFGTVQDALTDPLPEEIRARLARERIESVAICLLFAYLYPRHEQLIREAIRAVFGERIHVSLSSDILPEYREYERTSTTAINAYVAPLMGRYLGRLADGLGARPLSIMQSNGGVISAPHAAAQAARTVLSGPAGGVVGAQFVAAEAGFGQIITFDMGGTSTDVALCPGRLPTTAQGEIGGMPLRLPIIDIHTVGAGGGSLATLDAGGALQVGPHSAGADPGPACYGRVPDADEPQHAYHVTTTDANLILGRLDADHFLGGAMVLHVDAAHRQMAALARALGGLTPEEAAQAVLDVANATMERAIRRISVEKGFDPRLFTLVAFGGAGPLHACALAGTLGIPQVLIPPAPGVLSALGMLVAEPARDYSQTLLGVLEEPSLAPRMEEVFAALAGKARADMAAEGFAPQTLRLARTLDLRYAGQSHELTVPYSADLEQAFHEAHRRRYGYARPRERVELVTVRLTAVAPQPQPVLPLVEHADKDALPVGEKAVWFDGGWQTAVLYERASLRCGDEFTGPAVVFQYDTTVILPPSWLARVDRFGNLLLVRRN